MVKDANDNVLLGNLMKLAYAKGDLERAHTIHEMSKWRKKGLLNIQNFVIFVTFSALSGDNSLLIGDEIIYYSNYMALQAEKENLQTGGLDKN